MSSYEMKVCPDCKTRSLPANNICFNCNCRWIFTTTPNWGTRLSEAALFGITGISLVFIFKVVVEWWLQYYGT